MKNILKISPPYTQMEIEKLKKGFSLSEGHDVNFEIIEDKSLIGGFIAYVDGKVYDESLSSRLKILNTSIKQ